MPSEFSPGPWHVDGFHMSAVIRDKGDRQWERIAECDSDGFRNPNWQANARLIASAPAMYALLSNCRDAIASLDEGDLGYGEPGDGSRYPIRDEFLASIDAALLLSNTGGTGNG
jgi:hypothetical protein